MLQNNWESVFKKATGSEDMDVVLKLWESGNTQEKRKMLVMNNYEAFRSAACSGNIEVLDKIWEFAKQEDREAMLSINNYEAFRISSGSQFEKVTLKLWAFAGYQEKIAMLNESAIGSTAINYFAKHSTTLLNILSVPGEKYAMEMIFFMKGIIPKLGLVEQSKFGNYGSVVPLSSYPSSSLSNVGFVPSSNSSSSSLSSYQISSNDVPTYDMGSMVSSTMSILTSKNIENTNELSKR